MKEKELEYKGDRMTMKDLSGEFTVLGFKNGVTNEDTITHKK